MFVAIVFYLVKDFLSVVSLFEDEEGSSRFDGDAALQTASYKVVIVVCVQCLWQVAKAMETEFLFVTYERFSADATGSREEEFDEIFKHY